MYQQMRVALGGDSRHGFDVEEANAGGVCVESCPKQRELLQQHNVEACEGDERMASAVAATVLVSPKSSTVQMPQELMYGALLHNHLHQISKNFTGSAKADIAAVCDGQGKLSLAKLRSVQPASADAVLRIHRSIVQLFRLAAPRGS